MKPNFITMKRIMITVELSAEVPDSTSAEDLASLSLALDVTQIRLDGEDGPIPGARVCEYMTVEVSE